MLEASLSERHCFPGLLAISNLPRTTLSAKLCVRTSFISPAREKNLFGNENTLPNYCNRSQEFGWNLLAWALQGNHLSCRILRIGSHPPSFIFGKYIKCKKWISIHVLIIATMAAILSKLREKDACTETCFQTRNSHHTLQAGQRSFVSDNVAITALISRAFEGRFSL